MGGYTALKPEGPAAVSLRSLHGHADRSSNDTEGQILATSLLTESKKRLKTKGLTYQRAQGHAERRTQDPRLPAPALPSPPL